uniref:Uncharacterized protein n=1 Tax=Rhizophora mucronata TaxID=61149 RepID=A0A2P2JA59_RHIMU
MAFSSSICRASCIHSALALDAKPANNTNANNRNKISLSQCPHFSLIARSPFYRFPLLCFWRLQRLF